MPTPPGCHIPHTRPPSGVQQRVQNAGTAEGGLQSCCPGYSPSLIPPRGPRHGVAVQGLGQGPRTGRTPVASPRATVRSPSGTACWCSGGWTRTTRTTTKSDTTASQVPLLKRARAMRRGVACPSLALFAVTPPPVKRHLFWCDLFHRRA